jgi:hypothetical protein
MINYIIQDAEKNKEAIQQIPHFTETWGSWEDYSESYQRNLAILSEEKVAAICVLLRKIEEQKAANFSKAELN